MGILRKRNEYVESSVKCRMNVVDGLKESVESMIVLIHTVAGEMSYSTKKGIEGVI